MRAVLVTAAPFALEIIYASEQVESVSFLPKEGQLLLLPTDTFGKYVCQQLSAYLHDSNSALTFPCAPRGTNFQQRVWAALEAIPRGQIRHYGALAQRLSTHARAVGNACGANPWVLRIPCHRVIAQQGLGGFMQGKHPEHLLIKQWLLQHEGVL